MTTPAETKPDRWGSSNRENARGRLHRHEDGTVHRHFSAGFEIGGQVRPDDYGDTEHRHSTIGFISGRTSDPSATSGPIVEVYDE